MKKTIFNTIFLLSFAAIIITAALTNIFGLNPIIFLAVALILLIVTHLSSEKLTKTIISTINQIDLDNPEDSFVYEGLSQMFKRIKEERNALNNQINYLQKRKNQFDIIAANMQEGILIVDREENVLHYNNSAKKLLGNQSNEKFNGQNIMIMCRNSKFIDAIKYATEGTKKEIFFELNTKTIKIIANPIFVENIKIGTAVLLVDVSEAADREKLRREFSANVSHELKTPLSVISGYSELITNGLAPVEDITEIGKKIQSEAQHLLTLINDIIQISNLEEGNDFTFEKVNLVEFIESAIYLIKQKAETKHIKITFITEFAEENTEKTIEISAVSRLLDGILLNILENAVKYNKENGEIKVSVAQIDNFAVVEVLDTGIGIPRTLKHRVFERFFRVDSSRTGRAGTGLGLAIVKNSVKIHGGEVRISSEEGKWTKVTVKFPLYS